MANDEVTAVTVLVCGDRNWDDEAAIQHQIAGICTMCREQGQHATIIHGGARGADQIAGEIASGIPNVTVVEVQAEWSTYGRAAGPLRNKAMLDMIKQAAEQGEVVFVFAFHDNIQSSKGTKDMVKRAVKYGAPTYVISRGEKVL